MSMGTREQHLASSPNSRHSSSRSEVNSHNTHRIDVHFQPNCLSQQKIKIWLALNVDHVRVADLVDGKLWMGDEPLYSYQDCCLFSLFLVRAPLPFYFIFLSKKAACWGQHVCFSSIII
jgi:hypothetical protein